MPHIPFPTITQKRFGPLRDSPHNNDRYITEFQDDWGSNYYQRNGHPPATPIRDEWWQDINHPSPSNYPGRDGPKVGGPNNVFFHRVQNSKRGIDQKGVPEGGGGSEQKRRWV